MKWYYLGECQPQVGEMVLVLDESSERIIEAEYDDMSFWDKEEKVQLEAYYWRRKDG